MVLLTLICTDWVALLLLINLFQFSVYMKLYLVAQGHSVLRFVRTILISL